MNAWMQLTLVALGGGAGAAARALCAGAAARWAGPGFAPVGTLTVNVLGSLAMGLVAFWLLRRAPEAGLALADPLRALLMTGFLGGFTTFSTFSLDVFGLLEEGRIGFAAAYILGSTALSIGALILGWAAARALAGGV